MALKTADIPKTEAGQSRPSGVAGHTQTRKYVLKFCQFNQFHYDPVYLHAELFLITVNNSDRTWNVLKSLIIGMSLKFKQGFANHQIAHGNALATFMTTEAMSYMCIFSC